MPTHFQNTVNILKETEFELGPTDGLSTSGTKVIEGEFAESPIHSEEITRESVRELFNSLVLNGPADVDENGNVVPVKDQLTDTDTLNYTGEKPAATEKLMDELIAQGMDPTTAAAVAAKATGTSGGGAAFPPDIGGPGGAPKGPNLAAVSALFAGELSDDGLASPSEPGGFMVAGVGGAVGAGSAGLAGLPGFGGTAGISAGGPGAAFSKAATASAAASLAAAGAPDIGGGGWTAGTNTISGQGAPGAGGGGGEGGSDNPAKSSKIISGQTVGNLFFGTSTPTVDKSTLWNPWVPYI